MMGKVKAERIVTFHSLNWLLGFLGLAIIWFSSHSLVAVLGGVVAGLHVAWKLGDSDDSAPAGKGQHER